MNKPNIALLVAIVIALNLSFISSAIAGGPSFSVTDGDLISQGGSVKRNEGAWLEESRLRRERARRAADPPAAKKFDVYEALNQEPSAEEIETFLAEALGHRDTFDSDPRPAAVKKTQRGRGRPAQMTTDKKNRLVTNWWKVSVKNTPKREQRKRVIEAPITSLTSVSAKAEVHAEREAQAYASTRGVAPVAKKASEKTFNFNDLNVFEEEGDAELLASLPTPKLPLSVERRVVDMVSCDKAQANGQVLEVVRYLDAEFAVSGRCQDNRPVGTWNVSTGGKKAMMVSLVKFGNDSDVSDENRYAVHRTGGELQENGEDVLALDGQSVLETGLGVTNDFPDREASIAKH
ncbi:MAG: hypothetical protein HN726_02560 [Candidatus Magasanikbacteria bacterium]|jgi:hypothetical protein|nr:hypothetical protein [Candidatus Magasanikbacteria bacterium]MBT4221453.1 hypothetical protein [Candidatus Magasanikbacteria bacterium]MBT4350699.1 hypothetical protein [Candidatus Magasanikbacteria bacterium]MBT4541625.1 hypothetical protein [Candidatus Magasanikbacteria bacterium]MBT6252932.1 hypothetical protein [Candidatus Magasanikbacteria bacterium]